MNKLVEIVSAWATAINPSPVQKRMAEIRYNVCNSCEFKGENKVGLEACLACGCPLKGKIFTPATVEDGNCPKGKWPV